MHWLLIDGIGPFFHGYNGVRINWSKIPFGHLETPEGLKTELLDSIRAEFARFVVAAAADGFNALTLDDFAHLYAWKGYEASLACKIRQYRTFYDELFAIARRAGLRVFITTDIMFYTPELKRHIGKNIAALVAWWRQALASVFQDFPQLAGVIMRFGEVDGIDVDYPLRSELVLRTPKQLQQFLSGVLPVFQRWNTLLIFRTWSVGAHAVGDLIWHRRTFEQAFASLQSPHLILSMKYGESDFFRFLPLNAHFFRGAHQKIIEFQARREYEGFGEYPAFVGWEYERYLRDLRHASNVVGASVWCQTGGWGMFRRRTYLADSSVWVELNTFITAQLCQGISCEDAVALFCSRHDPEIPLQPFLRFLRLADEVINDLLYIRELAERKLFIRRLRVPPLLHVYWDQIVLTPWMREVLRYLVKDHQRAIAEGWRALHTLQTMQQMATEYHLPQLGLQWQYDTFEILATAREYIFGEDKAAVQMRLHTLQNRYHSTYRWRYTFNASETNGTVPSRALRLLMRLALREQREYRLFDHLMLLKLPALVAPLVRRWSRRFLPAFVRTSGMGIDAILK